MKKSILFSLWLGMCVAASVNAHAQGTFVFVNRVAGLFDIPIYLPGSVTGAGTLEGASVSIYTVEDDTFLASTTFRSTTGIQAAYLLPVQVTVDGNLGTPMEVYMQFEINGVSDCPPIGSFTVTPTLPPEPPANISSFSGPLVICPEPSAATIGLAALGLLALWHFCGKYFSRTL